MLPRTFLRLKILIQLFSLQFTEKHKEKNISSLEQSYSIYMTYNALFIFSYFRFHDKNFIFPADQSSPVFSSLIKAKEINILYNFEHKHKIFKWLNEYYPSISFTTLDNANKKEYSIQEFLPYFKEHIKSSTLTDNILEEKFMAWQIDSDVMYQIFLYAIKKHAKTQFKIFSFSDVFNKKDIFFFNHLIETAVENQNEYNERIDTISQYGDHKRFNRLELCILYLAMSEHKISPQTAKRIIISEYLNLANDFANPKSYGIINSILEKSLQENKIID